MARVVIQRLPDDHVAYATVMPAKAGIQYAAASRSITGFSGILDHSLSRVMTTRGLAAHD
jgi:hypothetical protein